MTAIWWVLTIATILAAQTIIPWQEFLPLGVAAFWLTLLWGVNLGAWPLAGRVKPSVAITVAAVVIYGVASLIHGLVRTGAVDPSYLIGLLVWHIAWFFVFSPTLHNSKKPLPQAEAAGHGLSSAHTCFRTGFHKLGPTDD